MHDLPFVAMDKTDGLALLDLKLIGAETRLNNSATRFDDAVMVYFSNSELDIAMRTTRHRRTAPHINSNQHHARCIKQWGR
jgi:hypothetical protein